MQETRSNKSLFKRLGIRLAIFVSILIFIIWGLPVVFRYLYPFIFAFILASIVNPLVNTIHSWLNKLKVKSSASRNVITFLLTIIILFIISYLFYIIFSVLIREIIGFSMSIQENWSDIVLDFERLQIWITRQMNILPIQVIEMVDNFTESILEFIRNFSRDLLNITVTTTSIIISGAGSFFLNFLTFFLALYFTMSDFDRMKSFVVRKTDPRLLNTASLLKNSAFVAVGGYIRTQLILAFVAFVFMFTAFTIYGQDYALTIAIILAVVDLLPLVGTIAVLFPWGVIEFIIGDPNKGLFLVLLGIGFFLFRRLTEPKIMGSQTGLHPLLALISIYVGIQFSGLWGALLGPLIMVIVISIIRSGVLNSTFVDLSELYHKVVLSLQRE